MNILFSSPEAFPLYKTGGLGDVAYSLSQSFSKIKNTTFLVLPAYTLILQKIKKQKKIGELIHPVTNEKIEIISSTDFKPVKLILLKNSLFENKVNAYTDSEDKNWKNNFETFALFSWGIAQLAYQEKILKCAIDMVISNDWQTGLVSAYIKMYNQKNNKHIKTAHIIHNIAFAGIFSSHLFFHLGLPNEYYNIQGLEYYNQISFQKSALYFSDYLFTVSPSYAKEIATEHKYGMGFEGLLNYRKEQLTGILNGVDYNTWSPKKDEYIFQKYTASTIHRKNINKEKFIKEHLLPFQEDKLLIGIVSRISEQKGIHVLLNYLKNYKQHKNYNFIILGTGDKNMCSELVELSTKNSNIAFMGTYDEKLSHQIIACSDLFLMPSTFEPCGLTQLYAMKYGTLPLVNPIGGLKDSVINYDLKNKKTATGFYLKEFSERGINDSLAEIEAFFQTNKIWNSIRKNAMKTNFSWTETAKQYLIKFEAKN